MVVAMSKDFYKKARRTEPDMRAEFNATMDGEFPEIAKKQSHIFRKMQRQATDPVVDDTTLERKFRGRTQIIDWFVPEEGFLIPCACVDLITKEPDVDHFCPICQGERYLWDEIFIDTYKVDLRSDVGRSTKQDLIQPGLTNIPLMIFYTRSSVNVTRADKVVELWTDSAGDIIRPFRRRTLFRVGSTIDFRSDNGKLEYWKLDCYAEQRKFLNGPSGG